jgi:hypothetical protein
MNDHINKHGFVYCMIVMALSDSFATQFKGVSHAQVSQMNWLDWMVSVAEFVGASGTVIAAYLKNQPYETPSSPVNTFASK